MKVVSAKDPRGTGGILRLVCWQRVELLYRTGYPEVVVQSDSCVFSENRCPSLRVAFFCKASQPAPTSAGSTLPLIVNVVSIGVGVCVSHHTDQEWRGFLGCDYAEIPDIAITLSYFPSPRADAATTTTSTHTRMELLYSLCPCTSATRSGHSLAAMERRG